MAAAEENISNGFVYTIVSFLKENSVDLVPSSWVYREEGQTFCWYPPKKDYAKLAEWTRNLLAPMTEEWDSFIVEIISQTKTLAKGRRRLARAYKTKDVDSTDTEEMKEDTQEPIFRRKNNLTKSLKEILPMPTVPETPQSRQFSVTPKDHQFSNSENNSPSEHAKNGTGMTEAVTEEYLNGKLAEMTVFMEGSFNKIKRSILYDIEKKTSEIKNAIVAATNVAGRVSTLNITEAKSGLGVPLPIDNLETFKVFDESLRDEEKRNALMALYRVLACAETTAKGCISKIMPATINKAVELHYSGTGRQVRGVGKLDFSKTQMFRCLQDAIVEKLVDGKERNQLAGKVGRWLSGANDRDGGRRQREKTNNENNA